MASATDPARLEPRDKGRPFRFLLAGGVNTLFGFAVFGMLALTPWPTWLCLMIGNLSGTAFNFVTLGGYVFRDLSGNRVPKFIAVYAGVYALNLATLTVLQRWGLDRISCQLLLLVPMAGTSYILMSKLVFTRAEAAT